MDLAYPKKMLIKKSTKKEDKAHLQALLQVLPHLPHQVDQSKKIPKIGENNSIK